MTSEARHTPGPWTIQTWPHEAECMGATLPGTKAIMGADRISPAVVVWGGFAEAEANARLIAAAPDLLELLRRIMGAPSRLQPTVVEEARALLARIEGGV